MTRICTPLGSSNSGTRTREPQKGMIPSNEMNHMKVLWDLAPIRTAIISLFVIPNSAVIYSDTVMLGSFKVGQKVTHEGCTAQH